MPKEVVHLVLKHHWFNEIESGRKTVEYREIKKKWISQILENETLNRIIFHRGYTNITIERDVEKVDIGTCPYRLFNDKYIRIHLKSP